MKNSLLIILGFLCGLTMGRLFNFPLWLEITIVFGIALLIYFISRLSQLKNKTKQARLHTARETANAVSTPISFLTR